MTTTEKTRRYWTPPWEVAFARKPYLPPFHIRPWSFKAKTGKIVELQAEYVPTKQNPMDGQRPFEWAVRNGSDKNPHASVTFDYETAKKIVELCREKQWPMKKGVAAMIDRDNFSKKQLAAIASAPEIFIRGDKSAESVAVVDPVYDDSTEAFFDSAVSDAAVRTPKAVVETKRGPGRPPKQPTDNKPPDVART